MSLGDLALTGDFGIVHEVVGQYTPEFAARGFAFKGITLEGSPELQRFPVFHFLNERTPMGIDISFFAAVNGLNGGFVVLLIKAGNHKLDVEDYLKEHGREALIRFFTYRDPATDVRTFADTFLKMLIGLFDREWSRVAPEDIGGGGFCVATTVSVTTDSIAVAGARNIARGVLSVDSQLLRGVLLPDLIHVVVPVAAERISVR